MARSQAEVLCELQHITLESDRTGRDVASVQVTCSKCGHQTDSYGTSEGSINRCLALLRQECPSKEHNFYIIEEDTDHER